MSAEIFQFVTVRPPRQVATMRVGLRRALRRLGERLWLLLHALSLLDGPGSAAQAITVPEDDYRRLAARHHPHE